MVAQRRPWSSSKVITGVQVGGASVAAGEGSMAVSPEV
ncbi:MAG: hypothetical protein JWL71_2149 [Acidobacteria bacterium]|nr:hypothetical protein [Acidobacteriota bacterium]